MKKPLFFAALFLVLAGSFSAASAQQIYRCASASGGAPEYINNVKTAQNRNCKLVEGGNVTVVQGTAVQGASVQRAPVRVAGTTTPGANPPRVDSGLEQRARDSDSRGILESELKKAESRLADQQKEYNNGEPEKQGIESRNYQRYLDRVAELKDSISRHQSDIAGLKRELQRLPGASASN
jgi:hypothetical protein